MSLPAIGGAEPCVDLPVGLKAEAQVYVWAVGSGKIDAADVVLIVVIADDGERGVGFCPCPPFHEFGHALAGNHAPECEADFLAAKSEPGTGFMTRSG